MEIRTYRVNEQKFMQSRSMNKLQMETAWCVWKVFAAMDENGHRESQHHDWQFMLMR